MTAPTLYSYANGIMDVEIARYLRLADATKSFEQAPAPEDIREEADLRMLAAGLRLPTEPPAELTLELVTAEIRRQAAVPFDIETSVTVGVYAAARPYAGELYHQAEGLTDGWDHFDAEAIKKNPHLLPIFQHVGGVFSKAALKQAVGSVSDNSISGPASVRLADLLTRSVNPANVHRLSVLSAVERTLEGIVRDLVGRVLLEGVVAAALDSEGVPYLREDEYKSLSGVVYDFRADFIIPDPSEPVAFVEVRKSSSRHASLYAKDKMFSAINWKGRHTGLIGVVVVEGDWTAVTLRTMASVFDYVVPLSKSRQLAEVLRRASDGDASTLKWLIEFKISPSPLFGENEM